jgi:diguanylate cyclase (GGDEF)-like protein
MEPESTPVVPANRLLEVAQLLSDGAARLHAELRDLPPERRHAVLDAVMAQVGDVVRAWSELVQAVVSVEGVGPSASAPSATSPEEEFDHRSQRRPRPITSTSSPSSSSSSVPGGGEPDGGGAIGPHRERGAMWAAPQSRPGTRVAPPESPPKAATRLFSSLQTNHETEMAAEPQPAPTQPAPTQAAPSQGIAGDGYSRDELTGVLNRQSGHAAIGREVERCRREGQHLVLGYLNVDGMREVNESSGPRAGDDLLRKVAAGLRATLRSYDVIMRLAGDEFLFSLPGADLTTAEKRIKEFAIILGEEAPGASVSVGFAELLPEDSVDDLVARADDALVQARRRRGRRRLR